MLYTARLEHHIGNSDLSNKKKRYMNAYLGDQIQIFGAFKMAFDAISKLRLYIK